MPICELRIRIFVDSHTIRGLSSCCAKRELIHSCIAWDSPYNIYRETEFVSSHHGATAPVNTWSVFTRMREDAVMIHSSPCP